MKWVRCSTKIMFVYRSYSNKLTSGVIFRMSFFRPNSDKFNVIFSFIASTAFYIGVVDRNHFLESFNCTELLCQLILICVPSVSGLDNTGSEDHTSIASFWSSPSNMNGGLGTEIRVTDSSLSAVGSYSSISSITFPLNRYY